MGEGDNMAYGKNAEQGGHTGKDKFFKRLVHKIERKQGEKEIEKFGEENPISTICHDCGIKHGTPRDGIHTHWMGICDWCGEEKGVTSARHYSWPKRSRTNQKSVKNDKNLD